MMFLIQGLGWEPWLPDELHVVALIELFPAVFPEQFLFILMVVSLWVVTVMGLGLGLVTVGMPWVDVFGVVFVFRPVFLSPVVVVQWVLVGANPPRSGCWVLILLIAQLAQISVTFHLPLRRRCFRRPLVRLRAETSRPSEQQRGLTVWIPSPGLCLAVPMILVAEPIVLLALPLLVYLVDLLLDHALHPGGLNRDDTRVYASGVVAVDGLDDDPRRRPEVVIVPDDGVATPRERLMRHLVRS